ncbi:MAG: THUMP domain-containing protein [Acidimicrobiia bacterium]
MLIAALDPEIYLKSQRTQRRMVGALVSAITDSFGGDVELRRLAGHRLAVATERSDAIDRLAHIFGIRAVETVEPVQITTVRQLAETVAERFADRVEGKTFAVRPTRMGSHDWSSQDLAVAAGSLLVEAGGSVDLSRPEYTVVVRVVDDVAYLTLDVAPGVGGLPPGTQGKALMLFSGGIDSPVAAFLMARRGVALDYLHFSLGCGQADHAAGVAHLLTDRYGAGTDPMLHVVDLEPAVAEIQHRVPARERQMALKGVMYRASAAVAGADGTVRALVNGESLGQVSTQTLDNVAALDRLISIPMLRPLIGLSKETIMTKAREIGTFEVSSRTRELCDIAGGARVSVSTRPAKLAVITEGLGDLVDHAVMTTKSMRLTDWMPGG